MAFALRSRYFVLPVQAGDDGQRFSEIGSFEAPLSDLNAVLDRVATAITSRSANTPATI